MRIFKNFIHNVERLDIMNWINSRKPIALPAESSDAKLITGEKENAYSNLYNLSNTDLTKRMAKYQGENALDEVPSFILPLKDRIAKTLQISDEHVFVQIILVNKGGKVIPHYDASEDGYVNYKCNIQIDGPDPDEIYIDKEPVIVEPKCLYCFESNLYKHWLNPGNASRMVLSFGFMLKNEDLGWSNDDPKVRLSRKIMKIVEEKELTMKA